MRFKVSLKPSQPGHIIPISYQYPLSAAVYNILNKADEEYAAFLHEKGYGKGFKMFSFSDLHLKFNLVGDRMHIMSDAVSFEISFHLPEASQNFIKGLFLYQKIDIADRKSRGSFTVQSVEALPNPFQDKKDQEILQVTFRPASAVVVGIKNEKGNYEFLTPEDPRFAEVLLYNWKEKIRAVFDEPVEDKILAIDLLPLQKPAKSRLITIKSGTPEETKIRGWLNFELRIMGEKRFVELLWNSGMGVYNSMGMGMVEKYRT